MRSPRFRLLVVLITVVAFLGGACVDDGELGGPSIGGSAAVSIGDVQLSHGELADLVDRWAPNADFLAVAAQVSDVGTEARRPAAFVNFALNFWIRTEQGRFATAGQANLDVEGQIDQVISTLTQQAPSFADYDEDFQRSVAESLVYQQALSDMVSQGVEVDLPSAEVSPRYGTIIELGRGIYGVEPPAGPREEPSVGLGEPAVP